jgi:hypothetical protein
VRLPGACAMLSVLRSMRALAKQQRREQEMRRVLAGVSFSLDDQRLALALKSSLFLLLVPYDARPAVERPLPGRPGSPLQRLVGASRNPGVNGLIQQYTYAPRAAAGPFTALRS